jgi:hypothetical protein
MVSYDVLGSHLAALMLVWGCAWGTGLPLASLLRLRIGIAGSALLGVAYWAVALYLFPFRGGLVVAAGLAVLLAAAVMWRRESWHWLWLSARRLDRADAVLCVGCAAYLSLLATQYVPPGMDASMHTTAARLIAQNLGLPSTYAPFAADLPFPRVNLGLPAFTAVIIRAGADPASAMLGCEHLTFSGLLMATYLLLRLWVTRMQAAVPAVITAWAARSAQETAGWGGFPTVMSFALGLLALRLLFDVARRPRVRSAVALGIVVAALPLVHGVGAAIWLYGAAPVAAVTALVRAPDKRTALSRLAVAGFVAAFVLACYRASHPPVPTPEQYEWVRDWQLGSAPTGTGWQLVLHSCHNLTTYAGSTAIYPALLAAVVLLVHRRFAPLLGAAIVAATLVFLIANSRLWILPGSFLLYPERVVILGPPLGALIMALGWQALAPRWRDRRSVRWGTVALLFTLASLRQVHHFQRIALTPMIPPDGWTALCWARDHLDPRASFVSAPYNTAGSYLPAVAGIACTGWHFHCFAPVGTLETHRARTPTHILIEGNPREAQSAGAHIIYHAGRFSLCTLDPNAKSP